MTIETCEKLKQNCLDHGDQAGADMYQARIDRKKKKLGILEEKKEKKK